MTDRPHVPCSRCSGRGTVPLTPLYTTTLEAVGDYPNLNGAQLAECLNVGATAMVNRLRYLERHGLIVGENNGRETLWRLP